MKRFWMAGLLAGCMVLSGCSGGTASGDIPRYQPPAVVAGNDIQTGEKTEAQEEKETVKTQTGDQVVVEDFSGKFPVVTEKNTFTVMNFNIASENGEGERSYAKRYEAVKQLLLNYNPDILTLQEAGSGWMDFLTVPAKDQYDYYLIYPDQSDKSKANTIFFKKEKFQDVTGGSFWLSSAPDSESATWSGAGKYNCDWLQLTEKATGNILYVFNAQIGGKEEDQQKAAALIAEKCDSIGWNKAIICNVDLGSNAGSKGYAALAKQMEDANALKLTTATAQNYSEQGTVADFSFYNKVTLQADSYQVITDRPGGLFPSDHNPMLMKYTFHLENPDYGNQFVF